MHNKMKQLNVQMHGFVMLFLRHISFPRISRKGNPSVVPKSSNRWLHKHRVIHRVRLWTCMLCSWCQLSLYLPWDHQTIATSNLHLILHTTPADVINALNNSSQGCEWKTRQELKGWFLLEHSDVEEPLSMFIHDEINRDYINRIRKSSAKMKTPERARTTHVSLMYSPFARKSLCYDGLTRIFLLVRESITHRYTGTQKDGIDSITLTADMGGNTHAIEEEKLVKISSIYPHKTKFH